jgi:hypothetical protein
MLMRIAYADPPYIGCAHLYSEHPDFAGEVDHVALIERLESEFDGWVLHASATPSAIEAAFSAVGRDAPPLDACADLARAVTAWNGDLDGLCSYVAAQFGSLYAVRRYLPEYAAALREAADHALWAERLIAEAAERERWATGADEEAEYREGCAKTWRERGDVVSAQRYEGERDSNRMFAKHCRETAAERRAAASKLTAKQAA